MKKNIKLLVASSFLFSGLSLFSSTLEDRLLLDLTFGYSHVNASQENKTGVVVLNDKLDKSALGINIGLGYDYSENIDILLNYQRVNYNNLHFDNIYISSRYKFNEYKGFTPYVGANLGYSQLRWENNPVNTVNNDKKSGELLVGTNLGFFYPLDKNLNLNVYYQFLYHNHETYVQSFPNDAVIEHKYSNGIYFGISYFF